MELGLGLLGLTPTTFWSMTPKELDAALKGRLGRAHSSVPPSALDLADLMARFPD